MPLNSTEYVQLSALQLELDRLNYLIYDREDIEYKVVKRWLENRVKELEKKNVA
jgi:hypothetical protein|tara:strand:- start:299 stop:460 length:162 start_codon:yes stop_codon:yes gene_type:complete